MNKTITIVVALMLILLGGYYFFGNTPRNQAKISTPFNATYIINGESFTLSDGHVEKEIAPNSTTKNKVSIYGAPVFGDIDEDTDEDALLILVNKSGDGDTFYYVAIAANIDGEYKGTDTILLGDRIIPKTFVIADNLGKIQYADRNVDEDFFVEPSVEKELHIQLDADTLKLIEVTVDFEGETDSNVMTLSMKTWKWIHTIYNDDTEISPNKADVFSITFLDDGTFSATTDCNSIGGSYVTDDNFITFGDIYSTKMYCEGSQENDFLGMLNEAQSYLFTSRSELVLELKFDTGTVIFR